MGAGTLNVVHEQEISEISSVKMGVLGTTAVTADGRVFRYGQAGAVALAAGKVVKPSAVVANHQDIAVTTAVAVGDTKITATLGATAATANQYSDGFVLGYNTSGVGQTLNINGNTAAASSGSITLSLVDPAAKAITTSGKISLVANPFAGVLISTTALELPVGVPLVDISASFFGWFQTKGIASVLQDGTTAVGTGLILSDAVNGAVEIEVAASVCKRVGVKAYSAAVDTTYGAVLLDI